MKSWESKLISSRQKWKKATEDRQMTYANRGINGMEDKQNSNDMLSWNKRDQRNVSINKHGEII